MQGSRQGWDKVRPTLRENLASRGDEKLDETFGWLASLLEKLWGGSLHFYLKEKLISRRLWGPSQLSKRRIE